MKRMEMMKLGEELATGYDKAAIGKINQLYRSAISQYGHAEEAINCFFQFLYLFETQGNSLCGGLKMFNDMQKIIRNDFILRKTGDSLYTLKSQYSSLSAEEWSYVLGYALRYSEIRSKQNRKDDRNILYNKLGRSQEKFYNDNINDKNKHGHLNNLKHKDSKNPGLNTVAKQQQSINTSLSEQLLKWKNSQGN